MVVAPGGVVLDTHSVGLDDLAFERIVALRTPDGSDIMPLTAEGIRPAIYFGDRCGRIVQDVLDGRVTLEEGLREYRRFVLTHRVAYAWLRCAQWTVQRVPGAWLGPMAELAQRTQRWWWPRYATFGRPELRDAGAGQQVIGGPTTGTADSQGGANG